MFKKKKSDAGKKKGFVPFKKKGEKGEKESSSDDEKPYDKSRKSEKHRPSAGVQAAALRSMKD